MMSLAEQVVEFIEEYLKLVEEFYAKLRELKERYPLAGALLEDRWVLMLAVKEMDDVGAGKVAKALLALDELRSLMGSSVYVDPDEVRVIGERLRALVT